MVDEKDWQELTIKTAVSHDGSTMVFRFPSGFNNLEIEVYEDSFDLTVKYVNKAVE